MLILLLILLFCYYLLFLNAKAEERKKPFIIGELFEDFTKEIFKEPNYSILHETPKFKENEINYNKKSLLPDLKFKNNQNNNEFWIECKYRSFNKSKSIEIISKNQLKRHKNIKEPVYILLGIGSKKPNYLFLIPVHKCYPNMYWGYLYKFKTDKNSLKSIV